MGAHPSWPDSPAAVTAMEYSLSLPVSYRGAEREFPFEIVPGRDGARFAVLVDEVPVVYERDDSGELRALVPNIEEVKARLPDRGLVEAIAEVIRQLVSPGA